jgi:hypothetical protein
LAAQRASKRNQKEVVLLRVPDSIRIVLDMAGLVTLFRIVEDPAELSELSGIALDEVPRAEPVKKNEEPTA